MSPSPAALELARRLTALAEPALRERVLLEYLLCNEPAQTVPVLAELHSLGMRGGPPFNMGLLALVGVLGRDQLSYERRASLYAAARAAGLTALQELFLSSRPGSGAAAASSSVSPDRELTLGHRKSLARSSDRATLEKLLRDPEPEVIPILLRNPRITERDVVALAARRPTTAELQRCVLDARRWIARYAVKRALVLNPCTPTDLALRLLAFLNRADLHLVRSSPGLPLPLREAASRLSDDRMVPVKP
jgi:hypothetical protein